MGTVYVRLHFRVRKFFCDQPTCPYQIFTERLPTVAGAVGPPDPRLARCLRASPTTLLRLAQGAPTPAATAPAGAGAWTRGPGDAGNATARSWSISKITRYLTSCPSAQQRVWLAGSRSIRRSASSVVIAVRSMWTAFAIRMEGFWSLLRNWLRPRWGISQEKLPLYLDERVRIAIDSGFRDPQEDSVAQVLWTC